MQNEQFPAGDQRGGDSQPPLERAIFRDEALRNYILREEKIELPAAVSPRYFLVLWAISLILLVLGLIVAFWPLFRQ